MIASRINVLVLSAALTISVNLRADTVLFDTSNQGPSSSLVIDGVTVTDLYGVNKPTTVTGYGLGDVTGPLGTYIISGNNPQSGVNLSVMGNINSLTVLPFAVDQNGTPVSLNFALSYELYSSTGGTAGSGFPIRNIYLTGSSGPMTFATPTTLLPGSQFYSIDLAAIDNSGGASEANYIATHPGVTSLTYGYVIQAADVTFVPEQSSTWALFLLGIGALLIFHRSRRCA